jgi:hypothetical protein
LEKEVPEKYDSEMEFVNFDKTRQEWHREKFYVEGGSTMNVEMMKGREKGCNKYDENLKAQILALPKNYNFAS